MVEITVQPQPKVSPEHRKEIITHSQNWVGKVLHVHVPLSLQALIHKCEVQHRFQIMELRELKFQLTLITSFGKCMHCTDNVDVLQRDKIILSSENQLKVGT